MKKLSMTMICLMMVGWLLAQDVAAVGMQDEFRQMTSKVGLDGIQTYSSGIVNGSQFFERKWSRGSITNLQKQLIQNSGYTYLFDKVRQQLFIKQQNSEDILLADKDQISAFEIITDKIHRFEPASRYDPTKKDIFFEVLVKGDSGYSLLKYTKTTFVKADMHDMEKVKSGENYDEFKDEVSYYISYNNGPAQKIDLKEKSIKKLFADKPASKKVLDYFQNNNGSVNENMAINLISYINR